MLIHKQSHGQWHAFGLFQDFQFLTFAKFIKFTLCLAPNGKERNNWGGKKSIKKFNVRLWTTPKGKKIGDER
jgi:hypothetical protein